MVWWIGGSEVIGSAIRQLEQSSDRAVAIIAATILETHLTTAIKTRWQPHPITIGRMLQPEGPAGSFGAKIDLALLMSLISFNGHHDLTIIKKIRNRFARHLEVDNFETPEIRQRCFELKHFTKFVLTDAELQGPTTTAKLFGSAGMDAKLQNSKERCIVAVQAYSVIFGYQLLRPPMQLIQPIY
jgi:hypothetical protein